MPDFGSFRGFGEKLAQGQTPTQLGTIGSLTDIDPDAQAFFNRVSTAGGTLSATEILAVNKLVVDMKSTSIWTLMKAIYPMVGASAAACAQNLKSSSFTGTFTSGWTFAGTGVTGDGVSAYMDTGLAPNGNLSLNNNHISLYSRTDVLRSQVDMGVFGNTDSLYLLSRTTFGIYHANNSPETNANMTDYSDSRGFFINNRISSSAMSLFRNNVKQTDPALSSVGLSSRTIFVSGQNQGSTTPRLPSNKEFALISIGDGLTDTQASDLYTAVQAFQTTLGRQV